MQNKQNCLLMLYVVLFSLFCLMPSAWAASASNLIVNGDFHSGLSTWALDRGSSYITADPAQSGASLLRVTGSTWAAVTTDVSASVTPGATYVLTANARLSNSKVQGSIAVQFATARWQILNSAPSIAVKSTSLAPYQLTFTVPPTTKYIRIFAVKNSPSVGTIDYVDFENFSLTLAAPAACGTHASGSTYTLTTGTTTGTATPTVAACPYGGTQATTITSSQSYSCTNGTQTAIGSPVVTSVNNGAPVCDAPAMCGTHASGTTYNLWLGHNTDKVGTRVATVAECPYGGAVATTTAYYQMETCINGTQVNQGAPDGTTSDQYGAKPICNAPAMCGTHASGTNYTLTTGTASSTATPTVAQCPYGGTMPTTTTTIQNYSCTNGVQTTVGSPISTVVSGAPACNAPKACGSTLSGSTITQKVSSTTGSIAATATQCSYGGIQPVTTTVAQVQLCTDGTFTNKGTSVSTTVNNGAPICNAPAACGTHVSGTTYALTTGTTVGSVAATVAQCPYGGTTSTTAMTTQSFSCNNGVQTAAGSPVVTTTAGASTCITSTRGVCGSADGVESNAAPTTYLCSQGMASPVTMSGGNWIWSCTGINGGAATSCQSMTSVPALAAAVGYTDNTFKTAGFSPANVDMSKSYKSGFQWYMFNFYGSPPTTTNIKFNSDGSISAGQGGNTYNANIASAGHISKAPGYVGTAFGGGAYIEAVIKFEPAAYALATAQGWPSFWANPLEGNMGTSQWAGQATGYHHYVETDILEYFDGGWGDPLNQYSATLHEWSGAGHYGAGTTYTVPQANFAEYNKVAMLWVPATSTKKGYINFYWNNALVHSQTYTQFTSADAPSPSATTPWTFGVLDQQHLVLEAGSNNTYPITIESVNVWQANGSENLHN